MMLRSHSVQLANSTQEFVWGRPVKVHSIGEYEVLEYAPHILSHGTSGHPVGFAEHSRFHPYIGGFDTHTSHYTLDEALLFCIAHKHCGPNEGRTLATGMARMVGLSTKQSEE